jgi:HupE / UreJ protein
LKRVARLLCVSLALLCAFAPRPAAAHGRSLSYSSWKLTRDGALVRARIPRLELTRLALDPVLEPHEQAAVIRLLAERVRLSSRGQPCVPSADPLPVAAPDGWVVYEWTLRCVDPGAPVISSTLLLDVAPSHLHFARVEVPDGGVREAVLSEAQPSWSLGELDATANAPDASGTSLLGYLALGIEHIATGYDHIAFVLALLLLAASLREVAGLVTGFTIGHSLTLALAVLGVLRPEPAAIEALIGFSIALVAAENSWLFGGRPRAVPLLAVVGLAALAAAALGGFGAVAASTLLGLALFSWCHFGLLERASRPAQVRAAVAFAFGLVHGFGFAGVLAEMELPTDRLVAALFGFNAGVEVGQLAVVALIWPLLRALARAGDGHGYVRVVELGSAAICGLGLFWFISRTFG